MSAAQFSSRVDALLAKGIPMALAIQQVAQSMTATED
jgi:hypothetical protein